MSKITLSKTIKMIENDCIIYLIKMNVISSKIIASITLSKTKINKDNKNPPMASKTPRSIVLLDEKTA
jgi:hypothetical protein